MSAVATDTSSTTIVNVELGQNKLPTVPSERSINAAELSYAERRDLRKSLIAKHSELYEQAVLTPFYLIPEQAMIEACVKAKSLIDFCIKQQMLSPDSKPTVTMIRDGLLRLKIDCPEAELETSLNKLFLDSQNPQYEISAERFSPLLVSAAAIWNELNPKNQSLLLAEDLYQRLLDYPIRLQEFGHFVDIFRQVEKKSYPVLKHQAPEVQNFFAEHKLGDSRESNFTDAKYIEIYQQCLERLKGAPSLAEFTAATNAAGFEIKEEHLRKKNAAIKLIFSPSTNDNFDQAVRTLLIKYFAECRSLLQRSPTAAELVAAFRKAIPEGENGASWENKNTLDRVYALKRWIPRNPDAGIAVKDFDLSSKKATAKKLYFKPAPEPSAATLSSVKIILVGNRFQVSLDGKTKLEEASEVAVSQETLETSPPKIVTAQDVLRELAEKKQKKKIEPEVKKAPSEESISKEKIRRALATIALKQSQRVAPPGELKKTAETTLPSNVIVAAPSTEPLQIMLPQNLARRTLVRKIENIGPSGGPILEASMLPADLKELASNIKQITTTLKSKESAYLKNDNLEGVLRELKLDLPVTGFCQLLPGLSKEIGMLFIFRGASSLFDREIADDDLNRILNILNLKIINLYRLGIDSPADCPSVPWTYPDVIVGAAQSNQRETQIDLWMKKLPLLSSNERHLAEVGRKFTFFEYGPPGANLMQESLWTLLQHFELLSMQMSDPKSFMLQRLSALDNSIRFDHARPIIWNKLSLAIEAELLRVFRADQ